MSKKGFRCPQCNKVLYLEDIIEHERDFKGGLLWETTVWSCIKCDKNYLIEMCHKTVDRKVFDFEGS